LKVTFTRRTFPAGSLGVTRRVIAPLVSQSLAKIASSELGSGIGSPSSIRPLMWNSSASVAMRAASSIVFPAVTHPGKSGNSTP
jgi:hypothetical protein